MNQLIAKVKKISISGSIVLTDLEAEGSSLSALLIDSDGLPDWLKEGVEVAAVIKETEISIAKDFSGGISMRNRLPCIIQNINKGELLSVLTLAFGDSILKSAITTRSVDSLSLKIGDSVTALIKANEISLMKY